MHARNGASHDPFLSPEPRPAHAPQVYVLSVPADEGDGWVFPTATHPLILDLANHVAPGKVDSRHVTCAPRLLCEVPIRTLDKYMIPFGTLHGNMLPFPGQGYDGPGPPWLARQGGRAPGHACSATSSSAMGLQHHGHQL